MDTNIKLMEFAQIFNNIQANRFICNLPSNVKRISNDKSRDTKKKKIPKQLINGNMNQDWKICPNKDWNVVFREKSKEGPILSFGCKPCLKYHCKGVCYNDCPNKVSHVTLTGDSKKKTNSFVKSLRGE